MAGAADTLKVLRGGLDSLPQSPDKPCWHNVIHMPPRSSLPKIHAAQLDFAYSAESRDTVTPPAVPARGCTRPLTVNTFQRTVLFPSGSVPCKIGSDDSDRFLQRRCRILKTSVCLFLQ